MTHKSRLAQLEKRRGDRAFKPPEVIETWGTREDGTTYLMSRRNLKDEMHARAMDTLAAALADETGEPMTGADAERLLQELKQ